MRGAGWQRAATILFLGYLCFNRTFAYLGIPSWHAFIGEAVLGIFLVCGPKVDGKRWPSWLGQLVILKPLIRVYAVLFLYGLFEVLRGIQAGYPQLAAIRDLAFNYYPLYLLLGFWVGLVAPNKLDCSFRIFGWINGVYGTLYILFLNRIDWSLPGTGDDVTPVQIFPEPLFTFIAILGLLSFERDFRRSWYLLLLNAFVLIGMQVRTEWLAFLIGLLAWFILSPRRMFVLKPIGAILALFLLMYVTDFSIPSPSLRTQEDLNIRQLVSRVAAPFRTDISDVKIASGSSGTDTQEGTFVWRTVWWLQIWNSVHASTTTALFGFGYGYALGDLVPYLEGQFIRTPHNQLLYALGYTGWVGVVIFYWFQVELFKLLYQARSVTGEPVAIVLWLALMAYALAFPLNETPYGAVPYYLLIGWLAAPALRDGYGQQTAVWAHTVSGNPLPAATNRFRPPLNPRVT